MSIAAEHLPLPRRDGNEKSTADVTPRPPCTSLLDIDRGQEWIKPFCFLENTAIFVR